MFFHAFIDVISGQLKAEKRKAELDNIERLKKIKKTINELCNDISPKLQVANGIKVNCVDIQCSKINSPADEEEEDIMKEVDKEELFHESAEESEEDETSEQNVQEDDDDNGNEELSPYEKIREGNIRRRKEEEQQSLKELFAAKLDLQPTQKPKKALKRKLSAPGPTTMSLRTRKKQ